MKCTDIEESSLILSNHVTSLDPFMVGSLFKNPLYYMASMDLFQHAFIGKIYPGGIGHPQKYGGGGKSSHDSVCGNHCNGTDGE